MQTSSEHESFYRQAALYDLAFSYRDYRAELDFILAVLQPLGKTPGSVLELAAGPARHALEAARRGLRAVALDSSAAMVDYGLSLARQQDVALTYLQGDMREFQLPEPVDPVDLALLMIDSVSYLLTQADLLSHLSAVAHALTRGGIYCLEMAHPKDVFNADKTVSTDWEMQSGETRVHLQWGAPEDMFDPITQISQISVRLSAETPEGPLLIEDKAPQRCYTFPELSALIALQGDFSLKASYGAFEPDIDLSHAKAWRMILLLERR